VLAPVVPAVVPAPPADSPPPTKEENCDSEPSPDIWGIGSSEKGWQALEAVAAMRVALESEGRVRSAPLDALPGASDGIRALREAITVERQRRNEVRRLLRTLAQQAYLISRLEKTTRVFCWMNLIVSLIQVAFGQWDALGGLSALAALVGIRYRYKWPVLVYVGLVVVGYCVQTVVDTQQVLSLPSSEEGSLRGLVIARVVMGVLMLATVFVTMRYMFALWHWPRPNAQQFYNMFQNEAPEPDAPDVVFQQVQSRRQLVEHERRQRALRRALNVPARSPPPMSRAGSFHGHRLIATGSTHGHIVLA
jgi:hypothetical protein